MVYEKNRVLLEQLSSRAEEILNGKLNLSELAMFNVRNMFHVALNGLRIDIGSSTKEEDGLFLHKMQKIFLRFFNFVNDNVKSIEKFTGIYFLIHQVNRKVNDALDKCNYYDDFRDYFDTMPKEDVMYCNGLVGDAMDNLMAIEKDCANFGIDLSELLCDILDVKLKIDVHSKRNENKSNVETST